MALADEAHPRRWFTTNLVGVPAALLGSTAFNAHPQPLTIAGVRATQRGLFMLLERCDSLAQAREVFAHHLRLAFGLARSGPAAEGAEARRWRTSYLKLLQGWGLDANGAAGAVLKGWVESRFGLVPAHHRGALRRFPSDTWMRYLEEKSCGRWHNNNLYQQLDLLWTFSQWALARFQPLGPGPTVALWRGSTRVEEQLTAGTLQARHCTVRLNNIVSLSLSREDAGCFGDWVFAVHMPLVKILYFPGLLDTRTLHGEGEVLALGGDYDVEARYD